MKLTAIIPTLNEEQNIRAAIESVSFADEVLVIDSYSSDNTVEIARELGARIIIQKFENFSAQKNRAIQEATYEWIILLDADERISEELRNEITGLIVSEPEHEAYRVPRTNFFMGKEIRYSGWQHDMVVRLIKKDSCRFNGKPVHEDIETTGTTGLLKNKLLHYTFNGFDAYVDKLNRYAWLQAEELNARNCKVTVFHLFCKPAFRFFRHYIFQQGFRDGMAGLTIAWLQSYAVFTRYVKLWLIRRKQKQA